MTNYEGTPLHGDKAAWNNMDFPGEHARDIDENTLQQHLPEPGAVKGLAQSDGINWNRIEENELASYILHSLAVAANDFLIASGAGVFVKKTLAQTVVILEAAIDHNNLVNSHNLTTDIAADYSVISGNDAGTEITAAELEELSDGSETILHSHAAGGADADAIHDNVVAEISAIAEKASPVGADVLVIEDSAASYAKKKVQITNLPGGADADAIHDNVVAEISAIAEKASPVGADVLVIEDSAASYAKKKVQITNLPGGGSEIYLEGGKDADHTIAITNTDEWGPTHTIAGVSNGDDVEIVVNFSCYADKATGFSGYFYVKIRISLDDGSTWLTRQVLGRVNSFYRMPISLAAFHSGTVTTAAKVQLGWREGNTASLVFKENNYNIVTKIV